MSDVCIREGEFIVRTLLLGNGGREAIIAEKLAKRYCLYSIMPYMNPTICEMVDKSGGKTFKGSPFDKELVKKVLKDEKIELCVVNNDDLLASGIIDLAKEMNVKTFGPTKKGAQIEWSKEYGLNLIEELVPEIAIKSFVVHTVDELNNTMLQFANNEFVVKPNGLTAGKGVKVGGVHFNTREEGIQYAMQCVKQDDAVIVQEIIEGYEFTIMGFTDGKNMVFAPATFDYPYRYDNDLGPGTGGMGCFSCKNGLLPFISEYDYSVCKEAMKSVLGHLNREKIEFNGVLNGGFFMTPKGIRFMEFNARLGDPEALNVLSVMETPFADVVYDIAINQHIDEELLKFKEEDTYVLYIVNKGYAVEEFGEKAIYEFDSSTLVDDIHLYFSSSEEVGRGKYQMQSNSRLFALVATGKDMKTIKQKVDEFAKREVKDPMLDYRNDIGFLAINGV